MSRSAQILLSKDASEKWSAAPACAQSATLIVPSFQPVGKQRDYFWFLLSLSLLLGSLELNHVDVVLNELDESSRSRSRRWRIAENIPNPADSKRATTAQQISKQQRQQYRHLSFSHTPTHHTSIILKERVCPSRPKSLSISRLHCRPIHWQ
jgi:hypothetical protein